MSSVADDVPEADCGLEDASLHSLWPRNQGQGQTTKLSSLGSHSRTLHEASPCREHHPCSTLGLVTRLSGVSEAKGARTIIPASVINHPLAVAPLQPCRRRVRASFSTSDCSARPLFSLTKGQDDY